MVLATIKSNYDAVGTLSATTLAAQATLAGYGQIPALPDTAVTGTDYNDAVTAQSTWRTNVAAAQADVETAIAAQKVAEATFQSNCPKSQWVKLTGLANWGDNTTQYVSWPLTQRQTSGAMPLFGINSVLVEPANPYPSIT